MRFPFTRRPLPAAPPEDAPRQVLDRAEAEIAVASLSGVAPSQILRHFLVVVDDEGALHVTTTCRDDELHVLTHHVHLLAVHGATDGGES